ncbi:MAG: succinate dehydrogenase [Armatimonadetes bacterium]|nr:succinate dehydrogenase [Armatimonadota bacterium]
MAKSETLYEKGFGKTSRRDAWWLTPTATFVVLSLFVVYSTWAALQNAHYWHGNYLSPFYSPEIFGASHHSLFGPKPGWWPAFIPFSPALIILPFPALFRFTCYYYRGAYYKAFWADPVACSVSEPKKGYRGENSFPGVMHNVHRYFVYVAVIFLFFLSHDAYLGFRFEDAAGNTSFGMGVGSLVLLLNVVLLSLFTFGCNSIRHLIGGYKNRLSGNKLQSACYSCVSGLNQRHMQYAWISLFGVMGADLYVRMVSMGVITDVRFF